MQWKEFMVQKGKLPKQVSILMYRLIYFNLFNTEHYSCWTNWVHFKLSNDNSDSLWIK